MMHISLNMEEEEEDLGHQQLRKSALNQQNEIFRLPNICSVVNSSHIANNHLKNAFFSLKIRNCSLFKAVPLPRIGKKVPPCFSDGASRATSSRESPGLLFPPEKDPFEELFNDFDSDVMMCWLETAHDLISELGEWSCFRDNFVQFAHFWLSELQFDQKQQLLKLEMEVIQHDVYYTFRDSSDSKQASISEVKSVLAAAFSEYSMELVSNRDPYIFLDYLNLMSSVDVSGYQKMLSRIQYTIKNPQIAEWLLAIRAFALASLWHAVVKKFYEAIIRTNHSSEQLVKNSVSAIRKQSSEVVKERAFQSVQLGYADVLDYLVSNQKLDLGVVDEKNRNLLFLATIYDQAKILDYFTDMKFPLPNINQAAENGNTPLHAAVNIGKMRIVSLLLHYPGINVNVQNPQCDGAMPLHLAIVYGHLGICYLLLNADADVQHPMGGLTPLQLAEMFGDETMTGLIKMHLEKVELENKWFTCCRKAP